MDRRRARGREAIAVALLAVCAACGSGSSPGQSIRVDGGRVEASGVRERVHRVLDRQCSVQVIAEVRVTLRVDDRKVTKTYSCKNRRD